MNNLISLIGGEKVHVPKRPGEPDCTWADISKIKSAHQQRAAFVYIRQSTAAQVEHNRESTARQYALLDRAVELGWSREQVTVVDEDLGLSGSGADKRSGFARLIAAVAMRLVGIVLGLDMRCNAARICANRRHSGSHCFCDDETKRIVLTTREDEEIDRTVKVSDVWMSSL